eukprot:15477797-Alexandrium_andersonii.AAC.1
MHPQLMWGWGSVGNLDLQLLRCALASRAQRRAESQGKGGGLSSELGGLGEGPVTSCFGRARPAASALP